MYSGNAVASQNDLIRQLAVPSLPDGGTAGTTTQPGTTGAHVQATIPYDEYGDNTSAPKHVGQVPATYQPPGADTPAPGAQVGGGGPISFEGDPILARIRAMNAQNIAQAEAAALAQRKRAEIGYGYDPNLKYEDAATAEAAKQNAFSTLYQLLLGHTQRAHSLDENLNKANLFYGSERANQVGLEGRQYTGEQVQQQGVLQNLMDSIAQGVLQTRLGAQQSEIQGESDAYNRALQFAMQYGTDGGGGAGGGGAPAPTWGGTGLAPGANSFAGAGQQESPNKQTVSSASQLDTSGGWGVQWTGPGTYVAYKFPPTTPGGGSDTRWVKVG
jgi:hypothetical protein